MAKIVLRNLLCREILPQLMRSIHMQLNQNREANLDKHILGSIDVLVDYKKGKINFEKAVSQFSCLTGLPTKTARNFIRGVKRDNIVVLHPTGKK